LFQQIIKRDHAHVYRGEKMKRGKIIIILATATALISTLFGVAYASYLNYNSTYQTNTNANTPYTATPRNDFWGWLGGCFGWGNQPYGYQYQAPSNNTAQQPQTYVPQPNPNQGYYPYGTGRGCWGW
jgi:hypothetical protein